MSAGNSFVWETGAPLIFNGQYDPGFTMALQNKDLQLGYDMARKFEVKNRMRKLLNCFVFLVWWFLLEVVVIWLWFSLILFWFRYLFMQFYLVLLSITVD